MEEAGRDAGCLREGERIAEYEDMAVDFGREGESRVEHRQVWDA